MNVLRPLTEMPDPVYVYSADGLRIATYAWGDVDDPTVIAVHGYASSARDNWANTGWVRDLTDAGLRVIAIDQRGHGASDKPHDPGAYEMSAFVNDVITVLDTYLVDEVGYLGYSLGGRVGWQATTTSPEHIDRAVLGGIPDGRPLARMHLEEAKAYLADGTPVSDPATRRYLMLAERVPGNDVAALIALAEGMRVGDLDSTTDSPPQQPLLMATGADDPILEDSRRLAAAAPDASFLEIPGRHHFNAPGSRTFREAGVAFLARG